MTREKGLGAAGGAGRPLITYESAASSEELGMKAAALPLSRAQVADVLAFVISSATFLAAQDNETGRCPKVVFKSPVTGRSALLIPNP